MTRHSFQPEDLGPWMAAAADVLATPLLILDDQARLIHANSTGRRALAQAQGVKLSSGIVRVARVAWRLAFESALNAAALGQRQLLTALEHGVQGTMVPLGLPPRHQQPAEHPGHVLLVLAGEASRETGLYAEHLGLTATQALVLRRLANGASPQQIAQDMACTETTVRGHVLAIRRRSGHRSLAGLLRTVAELPPLTPPAGP